MLPHDPSRIGLMDLIFLPSSFKLTDDKQSWFKPFGGIALPLLALFALASLCASFADTSTIDADQNFDPGFFAKHPHHDIQP